MSERKPVKPTVAVAAAALAVAVAVAAVGRLVSGPGGTPAPGAPQAAASAPSVANPADAVDRIRRAKVQAQLAQALGETEGGPTATHPAGADDPRLAPLQARLAEDPEDVDALLSVGYVYVEHHAYAEAREYYLRAARAAPGNVEARTHLGTVAYFLGNLDEALHHYEEALALNPDYAPAYFEMGAALRFGRHDLKGAIDAWEHFLSLDPDAEEAARIRELVAEARRMLAEGAPPPHKPAPAPAEPFDPATAPWPGQEGPDRSQGAPPEGSAG
jgi:tetratricopeptide (TPR) repeat protein